MNCSICKQPIVEGRLAVNNHEYHTQCYMDEFDVPRDQMERLIGSDPSKLRMARMTMLMSEGRKETHDAFETDWYRQRQQVVDSRPAISVSPKLRKKLKRKLRNKDRFRRRGEWLEFLDSVQDHTGVQEGCHRINQNNRD